MHERGQDAGHVIQDRILSSSLVQHESNYSGRLDYRDMIIMMVMTMTMTMTTTMMMMMMRRRR